jgi:hypothetical protein
MYCTFIDGSKEKSDGSGQRKRLQDTTPQNLDLNRITTKCGTKIRSNGHNDFGKQEKSSNDYDRSATDTKRQKTQKAPKNDNVSLKLNDELSTEKKEQTAVHINVAEKPGTEAKLDLPVSTWRPSAESRRLQERDKDIFSNLSRHPRRCDCCDEGFQGD